MSFNTSSLLEEWPFDDVRLVSTGASLLLLAVFTAILYPSLFGNRKESAIKELGGPSIITAWSFFTKRFDFIRSNFERTTENLFKFKVLHHTVVAVRGDEARKAFFDDRSLNFTEGYKILMGASPDLQDINVDVNRTDNVSWFNKQLSILLNRRRLADVLPTLFDDINSRAEGWGKQGQMDPFKNIYDLVFQMTVRMASCDELSRNIDDITQLHQHYWDLEKSATPTALLLPWFPGSAKRKKAKATTGLFTILKHYIDLRKAAKVPSSDAIDVLLGQGLGDQEIVGFILSVVFAGVINTGINSAWAMVYLACNPEWKAKVRAEVDAMMSKYTDSSLNEPLHKRLASIPIAVWEDELPALEAVIRETLRMVLNAAALRRNVVDELTIGGKVISKGDFMTYSIYDVHMNPEVYSNPTVFDPDRYSPGREEDKKGTFSFLGWGAGRHPCTGMKVAKLEIKIIIALFIAGYDYEVVDSKGNFPKNLPKPDLNDIHGARPVGEPCYLRFKRVVD